MFNVSSANVAMVTYDMDGCGKITKGTYECNDSKPSFGVTLGAGHIETRPMWNIDPSAFEKPEFGGNCTVDIIGWDGIEDDTWYQGQAWLKGKYVDFSSDDRVSVAYLKGGPDSDDGS